MVLLYLYNIVFLYFNIFTFIKFKNKILHNINSYKKVSIPNPPMDSYIKTLKKYKIAFLSVILKYDNITNKKVCFHPFKWQTITYNQSLYNPFKNALMCITGKNSNIVALDIDGMENETNQLLVNMCLDTCKFYNKTRKGYHFIFEYTESFPSSKGYKYPNDDNSSGFDIKSTRGCIYYGTYYINNQPIKYENIKAESIVPMPTELIDKLYELLQQKKKKTKYIKIKNKNNKNNDDINIICDDINEDFPNTTLLSIDTLDTLLSCLKIQHFENYNEWFIISFFIKHINSTTQALDVFIKYSQMISKYADTPYEDYLSKWESIKYDSNFDIIGLFYMARNDNPKLFNTIKFEHIGLLSKLYEPITVDSKYLDYDTVARHHFENKIIAIKSPYGSGKTQILSKLFNECYKDKRILFITSRITLSYSILHSFPSFIHYHDNIKGNINKCDKLIIQLDSLHKLNDKPITEFFTDCNTNTQLKDFINNIQNCKYDIIALDECESLLNHLSFGKLKTQPIYNILKDLCDNADKVIALDGDFSDRGYIFLSSISNGVNSVKGIVNMVKPVVIENMYRHPPKHFIFTNNRTTFDENIFNDLKNNLNIVIISLTLEDSEDYYKFYKQKYTTIIHNSNQNDKKKLIDINNYWNTARLLIYTSTIEAGCDFNIEWFDKCYIIISDKTASPRALMQMIHRVRHYKSNIINVFNNGVAFYEFSFPYTYNEVKYNSFKKLCNKNGDLNTLDSILCYNDVESLNRHYFITVFTNMIREKGSTYEYDKTDNPKNRKISNNIYDDINNAIDIHTEDDYFQYLNYIKTSQGDIEDLRSYGMVIKKYLLYKIWNVKPELMDVDWIKKHYLQSKKIINYRYFIKHIEDDNVPTNAKHNNTNNKIAYIQNILSKFGISHEDDFNFSIENGLNMEGQKINKKENPNIIDANRYNEIAKEISKVIITKDFRQVFDIPKLKSKDMSSRSVLECIKNVISEYGFEVNIISNTMCYYEDNKRLKKRENYYCIDLIPSIIDMYNKKLFSMVDEIENYEIEF